MEDEMKKNLMVFVILAFLVFTASAPVLSSETPTKHIIQDVPYHPMLDGFCAMSSLWMNMDYYGYKTDVASLLNLGWSYGFFYWKTPERNWIYPNTGPVEDLIWAAETLGWDAQLFEHASLEEAKATLIKHISKDIPVIVQWIGHTVFAFGYEETGDVVIYHDPSDPTSVVVKDESQPGYLDIWQAKRMVLSKWEGPPYLWGAFGYHCLVITPPTENKAIDWKAVWKRNAEKTLGTDKNPYPAEYGLEGIHILLEDMNTIQFETDEEKINYLLNFEGVFFLGTGFRREAAAFLAGWASADNNLALQDAAIAFRELAHLYRRGYNLVLLLKKDKTKADIVMKGYVAILEKIAEFEKKGADALLVAAK
jgi:hypothetical protein